MADEKTFSHITVSADDEDDFVIQAGAHPTQPQHSSHLVADEAGCEPTPVHEAPVLDAATDDFSAIEAGKPSPVDKNAYEETTLEDLKGSSMPAAQKAVLAAALLLVVAFIVYYLFLR